MDATKLSAKEAAQCLGVTVATFYGWLSQSDAGTFEIRGQSITIIYYQGGRRGQGRIKIDARELERLLQAMRVRPQPQPKRRQPIKQQHFPGITVQLGHPDCTS